MGKREAMKSEILRRKVREMLAAKCSVAQIVKATGKTLKHVTRIVEQERSHDR